MRRLYFFLVLLSFLQDARSDDLRINEVYPGDAGLTSNYSLSGHWIELFNDSDSIIQTHSYSLKIKNSPSWTLDLSESSIYPGNYFVQPLKNSVRIGEVVYLVRSDSILVDSVTVLPLLALQTFGRVPDGTGSWKILKNASEKGPNYLDYPSVSSQFQDWVKYGNAPFFRRDGAGAIVFKNEMWLLSGWEHGPLSQEIWKSKNGYDWEFVTKPPWPGRHQAGFVVFEDKMWVVSGDLHADVWSSSDGIHWDLVTDDPPWGSRYAPYVVVYDNKIWLMGGQNYPLTESGLYDIENPNQFNDVWNTTNGKDWTLVTEHANWGPRCMILGSVVFEGKMWIMGGGIKGYHTQSEYNDVWSSTDGISWTLVTKHAGWDPRVHMSTIVYNNKIWVTDGSPGDANVLTNEVWSSYDGINWLQLETEHRWSPRHATSLFNFDGSLWLVAGFNSNDVWRYTDPPHIFYSKSTGDISDRDTWGTSVDGSGETPANFSNSNQIFVLTNRETFFLQANFFISGADSRLVVGNNDSPVTLNVMENAQLSATVDVGAGSSLNIHSLNIPKLDRLGINSTVSFFSDNDIEIPATGYYNLMLQTEGTVKIADDVSVAGSLQVLSGTIESDSLKRISLYGDVYVDSEATLARANFRFLGGQHQQVSTSMDTLILTEAKIYKTHGQLLVKEPTEVKEVFSAFLHESNRLQIRSSLTLNHSGQIQGIEDEVSIPGKIILKPAQLNAGKYSFRNISISELQIIHQSEESILLSRSDFKVRNASINSLGSKVIRTNESRLTVTNSLNIKNTGKNSLDFDELDLVLRAENSVSIASTSTHDIQFRTLTIDLPDSSALNLSAFLNIRDTLTLYGGRIKAKDPFELRFSEALNLRFAGKTRQNITDAFPDEDSVVVKHLIVMNPGGLALSADLTADTLSLIKGDVVCLNNEIAAEQVKVHEPNSAIILDDGGTLFTSVSNQPHFLPLAFDSVMLPVNIQHLDNGEVYQIRVKLQEVDLQRTLPYAWMIGNISHPGSVLDATFYWPENIALVEQDLSTTNITIISDFDSHVAESSHVPESRTGYYAKAGGLSITEGLVLIGDEKLEQFFVLANDDTVTFTENPIILYGHSSSTLPVSFESLNPEIATVSHDTLFIHAAGIVTLKLHQEGNQNYLTAEQLYSITVIPASQSISISLPSSLYFDPTPLKLNGISTSGLPVSYEIADENIGYITGDSLFMRNVGNLTIKAVQYGNNNYLATDTILYLDILRAYQTVSFDTMTEASPQTLAYKIPATASSGLPLTFSIDDNSVATVSGDILFFTGPGQVEITATQPGNNNYYPASATQVFSMEAGTYTSLYDFETEIYPNPSKGDVNIKVLNWPFDIFYLQVHNSKGELIVKREYSNREGIGSINLTNLPAGFYILRVELGTFFRTYKFVVM